MALRFTLRRAGRQFTTIHTSHHLDGVRILKLLCRFHAHGYADFVGPLEDTGGGDLSAAVAERIIRTAVHQWGVDAYLSDDNWCADYTDREAAVTVAWAQRQVRRLYPAAVDKQFEEYVGEFRAPEDYDEEEGGDD